MKYYGILVVALVASAASVAAQQGRGAGPAPAAPRPPSPWASAPIDLTGYWVSIVNEDWRWRMVTPPKGDYASVPLNDAGRKVADSWTTARDGSCEAYGAAGLMRNPTRLHITWENENTLKVETDAGAQTRRFFFDPARKAAVGPASLQGHSFAEWERPGGGGRGGQAPAGGNLKVTTSNMRGGWLRKNGVPYSASAGPDGVLRPLRGPQRRRVAGGHHHRERPHVSQPGLRDQHALQEGSRRREVGAGAV